MLSLNMFDLVRGFAQVVDMVNTTLAGHHQRVAYMVDLLCRRLDLDRTSWNQVVMAAMLHDVGVIPLHERIDHLVFEKDMGRHSVAGWLLLDSCPVLHAEAKIIRYHHIHWDRAAALSEEERPAARLGNLIHLADTADVFVRTNSSPDNLLRLIRQDAGRAYHPESARAAADIFSAPGFFGSLTEASSELTLAPCPECLLSEEKAVMFSLLFSYIIDARSHFTATHSSGVAHLVRDLHERLNFPEKDRRSIFVAGLLHDIGKMGVPLHLLEKPGPLTAEEFDQVSRHARLSQKVLASIPGFEKIAPWGAMHHEKLNGRGYPDGLRGEEIPPEARLTAVADILTALTEDRPYRPGLRKNECLKILDEMVGQKALDREAVAAVHDNFEEISQVRIQAQARAARFFRHLIQNIQEATAA